MWPQMPTMRLAASKPENIFWVFGPPRLIAVLDSMVMEGSSGLAFWEWLSTSQQTRSNRWQRRKEPKIFSAMATTADRRSSHATEPYWRNCRTNDIMRSGSSSSICRSDGVVLVLLWLALFLILFINLSSVQASSRNTQVFHNIGNKRSHNGDDAFNFRGSLPKGVLVPPSAPSKKHNDIGLQSFQSP
ncbi:hypothetical protein Sjap_018501 [Stephania japonica]|uniref:Uncharacterized protein n=1 Tax=Stephania japonica TaxID=461633 RepID=A0AAP0NN96_9MAGN